MPEDKKKPVYRPSNPDALAIRWALECSYSALRAEAVKIVAKVLHDCDGNMYKSAEMLGTSRKTIRTWIERHEDLRDLRLKAASRRTSGRLPRELEEDKD